jgi:hypothetical protein
MSLEIFIEKSNNMNETEEMLEALKVSLHAFNCIRNQKISKRDQWPEKDTYEIASRISKLLKKMNQPSIYS